MAVARVNGTELFYTEVGQGVPCLVMHGGLGVDHTQFREWLDPLGDVLRLIFSFTGTRHASERLVA